MSPNMYIPNFRTSSAVDLLEFSDQNQSVTKKSIWSEIVCNN